MEISKKQFTEKEIHALSIIFNESFHYCPYPLGYEEWAGKHCLNHNHDCYFDDSEGLSCTEEEYLEYFNFSEFAGNGLNLILYLVCKGYLSRTHLRELMTGTEFSCNVIGEYKKENIFKELNIKVQ